MMSSVALRGYLRKRIKYHHLSDLDCLQTRGVESETHAFRSYRLQDLRKDATKFRISKCKTQCMWSLTHSRDRFSGYLNLCKCDPAVLF